MGFVVLQPEWPRAISSAELKAKVLALNKVGLFENGAQCRLDRFIQIDFIGFKQAQLPESRYDVRTINGAVGQVLDIFKGIHHALNHANGLAIGDGA